MTKKTKIQKQRSISFSAGEGKIFYIYTFVYQTSAEKLECYSFKSDFRESRFIYCKIIDYPAKKTQ